MYLFLNQEDNSMEVAVENEDICSTCISINDCPLIAALQQEYVTITKIVNITF